MNKRRAIAEVRELANDVIDQLERLDRGWDGNDIRDDTPRWRRLTGELDAYCIPSARIAMNARAAFALAQEWAKA